MTNQYGKPGESTHQMAARRKRNAILYAVIGIIIVIIVVVLLKNPQAWGIGGMGVLFLLVILKILPDILDRVLGKEIQRQKQAERGAEGEEMVGEILSQLDDTYITLNDIESPHGNIDHVVISKYKGIFLIETKSHHGKVELAEGKVLINGHGPEKDFIGQVLVNLYWLRDQVKATAGIAPWIHPLLVFTNAFVVPGQPIRGVQVINKSYLLTAIERTKANSTEATNIWTSADKIIDNLDCELEPLEEPTPQTYETPHSRDVSGAGHFVLDTLWNIGIIVAIGIGVFILFPQIMGGVFQLFGVLFGPLAIIMLVVFALPRKRRRRRDRY